VPAFHDIMSAESGDFHIDYFVGSAARTQVVENSDR